LDQAHKICEKLFTSREQCCFLKLENRRIDAHSRKEHLESQNQAISLNEFTGDLQDWMRRISLFRSIGVKIECRTDGLILKWRWINAT